MKNTLYETDDLAIIDPTNPIERCRLWDLYHLLIEVMGDIFPPRLDLSAVSEVLDVGCGDGAWACDVARSLEVPCVGIDRNATQLRYAHSMATMMGVDDLVTFEQMELTGPLAFADGSFDLVHASCLLRSLPTKQWPALLQECFRVLKVGGYVLLTQAEWASTNSLYAERLAHMTTEALWKAGLSFSSDGHSPGILHALPALLRASGGQNVQQDLHLVDFSYGQPHYAEMVKNLWTQYLLLQPFLTKMGYGSQHELFALCDRFGEEVRDETFEGGMLLVRTWAQKVAGPAPQQTFFFPPSFPFLNERERLL